jgi:pyrroloquinoline quinone biosynthesis protein B
MEPQSRNNTNPILDPHSAEYAEIRARGIEVAHDGMLFQVYT